MVFSIECTSSAGIWYEHVYYLGELWNLLISHYLLRSFFKSTSLSLQCTHARLGCSLIILSEIAWLSTLYIILIMVLVTSGNTWNVIHRAIASCS